MVSTLSMSKWHKYNNALIRYTRMQYTRRVSSYDRAQQEESENNNTETGSKATGAGNLANDMRQIILKQVMLGQQENELNNIFTAN